MSDVTATEPPEDPSSDKKSTDWEAVGRYVRPRWTWLPAVAILLGSAVAFWLGYRFVDRAGDEENPLTNLEQTFFGAYTLAVGAALSWLITVYYARRETREQFKQLARPALRRVTAARESADLLLAAIDRRRRESADQEPFRSLRELVEQHARVLDDAIADWRELLPVEAQLAQQVVQRSTQEEAKLAAVEDRMEEVERSLKAAAQDGDPDPRLEELRQELKALRTELRDRPRYGALSGYTTNQLYGLTSYPATGSIITANMPTSVVKVAGG